MISGAFLIPYVIMMVLEGMPLFLIELGIGQRLRTGPVGVWNAIHPYLGGVGVSAAVVSYLVGLYYNVILTWCIYYLWKSFSIELPWAVSFSFIRNILLFKKQYDYYLIK